MNANSQILYDAVTKILLQSYTRYLEPKITFLAFR